MPLKYYPLTRIRPNLYTRGNEFTTPNGKPYIGKYYLTYQNRAFTGINPVLGTNEELTALTSSNNIPLNNYTAAITQNTQKKAKKSNVELEELSSYFPIPIASDYSRGYFTRYFAKKVSGLQNIIEISQMDYAQLQDKNISPTILGYESTSMLWQLTGPMYDTRKSQYEIVGGVYTTNKRVTESKQKTFNGILEFIGENYTKYAKITDMPVANSGSM
jgi:hypothetical protein